MKVVIGKPQSGKTTAVAEDARRKHEARLWRCGRAIKRVVIDGQADLGRLFIRDEIAAGRGDTVFVNELRRTDRVYPDVNIWESGASDELERLAENERSIQSIIEPLFGMRNLNEADNVLILERAREAVTAMQDQRTYAPLHWLSKLGRDSFEMADVLRGCKTHSIRDPLEGWNYINGFQYRQEIGPTKRLFAQFGDASVIARCGTADFFDLLTAYDTIVILGRGATNVGMTFLNFYYMGQCRQWCELGYGPLEVYCDESGNWGAPRRGVWSDPVLRSTRLDKKYGWDCTFITQTPAAIEPEVFSEVIDVADEVWCFALGDPKSAQMMADIMAKPDPYCEHHTDYRERMIPAGYDEVTVTETVPFKEWAMRDENLTGATKKSKRLVARHERVVDETVHYMSTSDQKLMKAESIMEYATGEHSVSGGGRVRFEKARRPFNPFLWPEISNRKVDEFLEAILEREEYQWAKIQLPSGRPWKTGKKQDGGSRNGSTTHAPKRK